MPPNPRAPQVKQQGEVGNSSSDAPQASGGGGKKATTAASSSMPPRGTGGRIPRSMPSSSYGGGMGYGGGYGGMSGMGMMNPMMGMGMMGMGMGMGGLMDNPLMRWMYVLNSSMYMLGQVGSLLYMNANSFYSMIRHITELYKKLKEIIAKSSILLWVRDKTKKSKLLRWLLILLSMYLTSMIYNLLKRFVSAEYARRMSLTTGVGAGMATSSYYDSGGQYGNSNISPVTSTPGVNDAGGSSVDIGSGVDSNSTDLGAMDAV